MVASVIMMIIFSISLNLIDMISLKLLPISGRYSEICRDRDSVLVSLYIGSLDEYQESFQYDWGKLHMDVIDYRPPLKWIQVECEVNYGPTLKTYYLFSDEAF